MPVSVCGAGPPLAVAASLSRNPPAGSRENRSFLRHAGLAQTRKNRGFDQSAGPWHAPIPARQLSDARKIMSTPQPLELCEFGSAAFGFALQGIGRSEESEDPT